MKIAAITYARGQAEAVDALLCELALKLKGEGYNLAGSIQWNGPPAEGAMCDFDFEDLATGTRIGGCLPKSGRNQGCRLDAPRLEDAAGLTAASIVADVDLVIINRFGKEELSGRGFRQAFGSAVEQGLPVLTALNHAQRDSFGAFTGEAADNLTPDIATVEQWCRGVLKRRAELAGG